MKRKIYFAGSIRGGRDDKELYFQLIQHLSKYGDVLTEHVGDGDLTDWGEDGPTDEWIFNRDVSWIEASDVVIAEVSTPSLGVGYEIARAETMNKKILCLYRNQANKRLSAMINGCQKVEIETYDTYDDAVSCIDDFFESLNS